MPAYVVRSDAPISVREVNRPDLPDWGIGGGPIIPEGDWRDYVRDQIRDKLEGFEPPELPPREDWPPLPPIPPDWRDLLGDYIRHPPARPLPLPPEVDPPTVWPPLPELPEVPDFSGKTLILARFYVSRHVNYLRWVVIDHAEAKSKLEKFIAWIKANMPAGGIGGRPPDRPLPPGMAQPR